MKPKLPDMISKIQELNKKSNLLIKATQSKQASQNIADENIEKIKKIIELLSKYELFVRQQNDLYNITEPKKIDGVKEQLTRIEGYFNDFDIEDIKKSKKIIEEIDLTKNDFLEYSEKEINDKKEKELIDQIEKEFRQMSEEFDIYTKQEINKPIINYNVFNQVKDLKSIPGYDAIQQNSINEKQDISYLDVDPTIAMFQKLNFLAGDDRKKIYEVENTQTENKGAQIIKNIEQFLEKNLGVSKKAEEIQINTYFPIDSVKIQDKNVFKSLNVEKEPFIQQGKMRDQMYYPKSTDEAYLSVTKLFFEKEEKVGKNTPKLTKTIDLEELQTGGNPITAKNILDELKINSRTNNIKFLGIEAKITQKTTIPGKTIYKDFEIGKNEFDKFFSQDKFTPSEKQKVFGIYKSAFFEKAKINIETFLNTKKATKNYSVGVSEFISSVTQDIKDIGKINEFKNRVYNFFGKIEKTSDVESYYTTENILFKNTDVKLNIEWPSTSIEEISRPGESSLNAKFERLRMHNIFHFEQQTVKKQMTQFDIETESGKIVEIGFYTKDINNENGFKISIFNSNVDDLELKKIKAFKELGQYTKIHNLIKELKTNNKNQQNQIIKKVYTDGHITYLQDLNSDHFFNNILDDLQTNHSIDLNKSEQFIGYNTESFDIPLLQGSIKDNVFKDIFLNKDKNQDIYGNGLIRHELAQKGIFLESYKQENVQQALGIDVSSAHIGQHDAETTYKIADQLNLVTKGQPNVFENLINYFRKKFTRAVYDGTRNLTGNKRKIIVTDKDNSIYVKEKEINDAFEFINPTLESFPPQHNVNSVIMFDGEDFQNFNIEENKINVQKKKSRFDFKIKTNYSPKRASNKISYEQAQNGIVAYLAEERQNPGSGDNVLISEQQRKLLRKMKLNVNKQKTYTQNMFNVSLIKEIQITKDVNFVYKDIKGDEYDDTDIITKNFPLRPTINEFYKTFKEKFEKEFKTQLNSTTKIKDLSDMKTSFIFDKTFDDLLENTKELAPIWANRTEEEYKEYIKDLKAYFKSYYKLIQGAEYNLTLKPKDLMLNDELYFKSIKPETYKRLFKSIEPTINKFYKTFKKEFEKEFKTQINSAKKTKDLSNMIASFIFDKTFDDSLKNTKLLAPIKKNKTKKEQKKQIEDLKAYFKSYYNLTQGATDDLALKPTDIKLNDEQDFEQIKSKINKFYKTFKEKFEKKFKTQLNSATKTKNLSNMITSFIFDKTFDDLLENTKELEPIQTNRTKKEYKKYIENLKRVFKSYYNLTQGAKDDLALKPTDIMLKYEQYFESRESEINEFYNVFEKEFEAQLSFAKEENIRISKNMGVKNPTGNIGEAKISLIFDDVFYKTLEEKKGFKELINWDEIKKNKKDEKLNYKIQPLDYVFVWPYDDKIIKNNKIKNFYQSNINKTKSYKFIENLRKGFKAYYKGRFVTGRGLTDSPADYVVYDEKLEITKNGEKVFDTSERMKENSFGEDIERTKTVTKNVEIDYKDLINKYIKEVSPNNDNKNEYLKTLEMFKNNFQNKPQTGFEEELFNLIEGTERKLKLFLEELYENEHINDYNNLKAIQEQTIRIQLEIFDYQKKFKKSKFSNLFYEALNHQIDLNKKPEQSIYKIDFANIDVKGLNRQSKLLGFINYVLTTNTDELQYKAGTSEKYIGKSTTILNKIKTEKIKSIDDYNDLKNILLNIIQSEGEYSNVDFTAKDFDNLPSFFILDNFFNITSNKTITKESIGKISALQGIYNFFEIAKGNKNAKRIKKNIEELKKLFGQLSGNNNSISILGFKLITNLNKEVKNKTFDFENALKETFGNAVYITDSDFFNYLTEKEFDPSKIVYLDENAYINGEESQETISDNVYDEETLSDNIQDESTYHNNPESNQLNERQKEQEEIDRKRFNFLIGKRKASVEDPYKKEDIEPLNKDVKNIITAKIDNIMQEMVLQKQNTPQSKPIVQDTNIQQNQGKQNQEVVNTIQNLPAQSNSNIKNQSKNTNPNASISTNGTQPTVTSVAQTSKSLSKQNKTLANTQKQITNKTQGKETIKQFSEFKSIGIYSQLIYFTKLYFAEDIMLLKENGFDNYFFQNLTDGRKTDIDSFLDTFIELSELKKVMNNMESKRSELNQVMNNQKSQSSNFRMTEFKDSKTGKNLIYDSITKKLYKNGNDFISKNKNALKTDAYRMFDYIKYGKIKTQDAFGNDIKKSLADLIYEYNDILKEKDYNPSKLYYSEKEHMNKNIKLFVEQLVNKKFDEFGGKVLGQGKKQINQNQFYKQLELMKKIYDVTSLFFNKPKWKNMDALLCFSNEKDAIIKEEIFNSYFKLGIEIQKKAEMNEQEQQQLYIKLFEYFIDKNDLNKVNLKDKKELFNVIDFYNETKKLNKQENRQKNILRDIYSREKTSYILLDNKKYFIKTDFEKVRITDIDKEEQIFDINNPIKIKEKEYKVGIKNGFISFIRQSDNEEIIEEIIPEHDYGEITIGKKVYTIIDDKHLIRYLVDEKGGKNLYQLPDKDGAIIKQLKLSDQMQTNTLDKNYKTNFYKKQLYDFQEMYEQPKQKNFMMSFLYSYLQIKKNNDEQFNNAMENKEFINKIINKTLGTNDRDYIQETELFINKFKENNKILFDGIEYTIFDQEESAIEILKEKYKNINNLFYYNKKETIIINSLELQNDLQIKVNMSVINKFKDENILGNETKLKKHIEDLIDNINKAKDEKEKQDFIAELNKVLKSPKDTSTIDTSPLKNIVNKLQIISENEDSNKLKKFTDLKDNQYLEQLFAFKDIEKSFYIKDKNGEVMHLYNIKIQLSKESSRNANNNNINLLVERIEKEFEVERETAVYAADLILNGSITDRIFKQIIDKIKVDEKGNANEIEFEEKIVTRLEDIKQEIKDSVEKTKVSAEEIIEKDKEIFGEQASKTNFKIKKYQIFGAIQAGVQQTIGIGINQKIKQEQKQQSLYQTNTALKYNPSIDQELEEPNFGMTLFSDDYANNIITSVISGHGSDFIQDNIVVNLYNKRITRINNATN